MEQKKQKKQWTKEDSHLTLQECQFLLLKVTPMAEDPQWTAGCIVSRIKDMVAEMQQGENNDQL